MSQAPQNPFKLKQLGVGQVKMVNALISGIVTYRSKLGDTLKAGAPFADVVFLDSLTAQSIPIMAPCNGVLFSITGHHFVAKGHTIAMLATDKQKIKVGTQLTF